MCKEKHLLLLGTSLGPGYAVGEKGKEELNKKKIGERSESRGAKKKSKSAFFFFFCQRQIFLLFPPMWGLVPGSVCSLNNIESTDIVELRISLLEPGLPLHRLVTGTAGAEEYVCKLSKITI